MYCFTITHIIIFGWIFIVTNAQTINTDKLNVNFSWKTLDFYYPNDESRQDAIDKGLYVPGAAVSIDIDRHNHHQSGERIFITTPRFVSGVPATVSYLSDRSSTDGISPLIKPYPNLKMNTLDGSCDTIISVYRIQVDECDRLWIMDTGVLLNKRVCSPQLLVFDLLKDQLISRYRLDNNTILGDTLLITPIVDIRNHDCSNAFVYIADVERYQLFVYDYKNQKSWSIRNKHFYPYPDYATFTINNLSFDLMDGLFGMALGPIMPNHDRTLYFHALASVKEKFVYTSLIRNLTKFQGNPDAEIDNFGEFPYERTSQSAAQAMTDNGILFYGSLSENAINCWNSKLNNEFGINIDTILKDNEKIQFTSGVKIIKADNDDDSILINSIPYQRIVNGRLNKNETNFRILGGKIRELISGTKCDLKFSNHHHYHHRHHHTESFPKRQHFN